MFNKGHFANFAQNQLSWHASSGIGKRGLDRENSHKYLLFGEKIVKIGSVDPEIIWLKLKKSRK